MTESKAVVKAAESAVSNVQQEVTTAVQRNATKVKTSNLQILRNVLSAGRYAGI